MMIRLFVSYEIYTLDGIIKRKGSDVLSVSQHTYDSDHLLSTEIRKCIADRFQANSAGVWITNLCPLPLSESLMVEE